MTGNIHQNYNARDVINAPEVKTAILQRSLFRQDNETIQKWLLNHFYRWLISDFPMVQQINSLAEYSLFNKNDDVIPEWLVSKFNTASVSTATLYYIETDHQQILTKERGVGGISFQEMWYPSGIKTTAHNLLRCVQNA